KGLSAHESQGDHAQVAHTLDLGPKGRDVIAVRHAEHCDAVLAGFGGKWLGAGLQGQGGETSTRVDLHYAGGEVVDHGRSLAINFAGPHPGHVCPDSEQPMARCAVAFSRRDAVGNRLSLLERRTTGNKSVRGQLMNLGK
ncbi:MAG: hypothetical protein ACI8Y4_004151, partial [Candidatus Poriferisodalaceae bacterium]